MHPLPFSLERLLPAGLLDRSETHHYPAGVALFLTGDRPRWMFFVSTGEVILERHGVDGQLACLQRCQSGAVGEASLTSERYHCDGRTTRRSTVTRVPIQALRQAIKCDADFAERWIAMLSRQVRQLRLQNERLSLPRVQDRLRHLIETEGVNGSYEFSCSIKELAKQMAVSHEALYRAIALSVAQGHVVRQGNSLSLNLEPRTRRK